METPFTKHSGAQHPIICGAMYPCSNKELIAAASAAGALGIVQPISLEFAHKTNFRAGLEYIRSVTQNPIGMNIIVEKSVRAYDDRMKAWMDTALEMGVRFFITALGNPKWVIDRARAVGGVVYHDVTERKWALKAVEHGVDGLICVNNHAGGHAGGKTPEELYESLHDLGLPLICAGGVGDREEYQRVMKMGYAGVQMGTRFIASEECKVHPDYKAAILRAKKEDIVLTEKLTGVPVAIIQTDYIKKIGTKAGPIGRLLLKGRKTKHWMRTFYSVKSLWSLRAAIRRGNDYREYYQAGKSVDGIERIEPVAKIVADMVRK